MKYIKIAAFHLVLFMLFVFNIFTAYSQSGKSDRRPNVIYIISDQLRHDALGYSGNIKAKTPNIDKLAKESLNFVNCVTVTPACAPYRASLLTGKYTSSTAMVINELRINPHQTTIADIVDNYDYNTCYIGKWHLYADEAGHHDEIKNAFIPPGPYRLGFNGVWKAYNFHHLNFNSYYFENTPKKLFYDKPYEPEAQFDMAIDYIQKHAKDEKPFFLVLSIGIPHDPWTKDNVPEKFYKMYKDVPFYLPINWKDKPDPHMDRNTDPTRWLNYWKKEIPGFKRSYYAMVSSLDEYMGRLINTLNTKGISKNTIVVFTADHGEMFGENGHVYKNTFYESAARVPFLIRWKGHIPAGLISDALINTPDIMPTLLGLMHLPIPKEVEGVDLSKICLGEGGPQPKFAFLQGMGHTYLWKDGYEWRAVRNKRFTYAIYLKDSSELLFDNLKDPLQMHNMINDPHYKNVYDTLKKMMHSKMSELNDKFKPVTWYRDHWTDGHRNIISSAKGKF